MATVKLKSTFNNISKEIELETDHALGILNMQTRKKQKNGWQLVSDTLKYDAEVMQFVTIKKKDKEQ